MQTSFEQIDSMVQGYRAAQVVLTANRLGLFALIGSGRLNLEMISEGLGTDRRGTRILCDALAALSLLEKTDGKYRNSPASSRFLLPDSPESRVSGLLHAATQYEKWGGLLDAVIQGRPTPGERIDPRLRSGPEEFARAMADIGRVSAAETSGHLDLGGGGRMLDIGGGPAVYAIEFARKWPRLTVEVLDDAETLKTASENIRQSGLSGRIHLIAGDVFKTPLDSGYDFVFVSNLVHIYSYEKNTELLAKCAEALKSGGEICIKDFILDSNRISPPGAALFAVNMLVSTESGDCYTEQQVISWFEKAGIQFARSDVLTNQTKLMFGRKVNC